MDFLKVCLDIITETTAQLIQNDLNFDRRPKT